MIILPCYWTISEYFTIISLLYDLFLFLKIIYLESSYISLCPLWFFCSVTIHLWRKGMMENFTHFNSQSFILLFEEIIYLPMSLLVAFCGSFEMDLHCFFSSSTKQKFQLLYMTVICNCFYILALMLLKSIQCLDYVPVWRFFLSVATLLQTKLHKWYDSISVAILTNALGFLTLECKWTYNIFSWISKSSRFLFFMREVNSDADSSVQSLACNKSNFMMLGWVLSEIIINCSSLQMYYGSLQKFYG